LRSVGPQGFLERLILWRAGDWPARGRVRRVLRGPLRGIPFGVDGAGQNYYAKLLGTYERELHPWIRRLSGFDQLVNVGAADGYYAIGLTLALNIPDAIAFEMDPVRQALLIRNRDAAGLGERLRVRGECDVQTLASTLATRSLVVMDVEGAERELLDPERVPQLRHATILVEVHDFVSAEIAPLLQERTRQTHKCDQVWSEPRTPRDLSPLLFGPFAAAAMSLMDEYRPSRMRWFLLEPLSSHHSRSSQRPGHE
jgi:hypothetical protein